MQDEESKDGDHKDAPEGGGFSFISRQVQCLQAKENK